MLEILPQVRQRHVACLTSSSTPSTHCHINAIIITMPDDADVALSSAKPAHPSLHIPSFFRWWQIHKVARESVEREGLVPACFSSELHLHFHTPGPNCQGAHIAHLSE